MNYNYWLLIGSTTLGLAGLITAKTRQLKWFAGGAVNNVRMIVYGYMAMWCCWWTFLILLIANGS